MKSGIKKIIFNMRYYIFSAVIVVSPLSSGTKISNLLFGNNLEHVEGDEFYKIEKRITKLSKGIVSVLRFPGGEFSDMYSWVNGIGPISWRPPARYYGPQGPVFSHSLGTHEVIEFCKHIGAEPLFTVNVKTGTPEEARCWVQYCNAEAGEERLNIQEVKNILDTLQMKKNFPEIPLSYFPLIRSFNGAREPFRVKFWEIGNEVYWHQEDEDDSIDYASKVIEYTQQMKSVNKDILIGVSFDARKLHWNDSLMKKAKDFFDFICIHLYGGPGSSPPIHRFYSNKFISKEITFEKGGFFDLFFDAYGDEFLGYPILEVRLDNTLVTQVKINSKRFKRYSVKIQVPSGRHKLSLGFVNDLCAGKNKDRNLYFTNVTIDDGEKKKPIFDSNDEYRILFIDNITMENQLREIKNYLSNYNFKGKIAVTEGGSVCYGSGLYGEYNFEQGKHIGRLKSALFVAGVLNSFIRENVWMYNFWNLFTTGYAGLFRLDGHVRPDYYVLKLYADHVGDDLLNVSIDSPIFEDAHYIQMSDFNYDLPYLDAIATIDEKRMKISLMVISRHPQEGIECLIDLNKFNVNTNKEARVRVLLDRDGKGMEADNEIDPHNVEIKESHLKLDSGKFKYNFSAHSLTNIEIPLVKEDL